MRLGPPRNNGLLKGRQAGTEEIPHYHFGGWTDPQDAVKPGCC